jgi:hypothetical protein
MDITVERPPKFTHKYQVNQIVFILNGSQPNYEAVPVRITLIQALKDGWNYYFTGWDVVRCESGVFASQEDAEEWIQAVDEYNNLKK